jgi:hypothetical protein
MAPATSDSRPARGLLDATIQRCLDAPTNLPRRRRASESKLNTKSTELLGTIANDLPSLRGK